MTQALLLLYAWLVWGGGILGILLGIYARARHRLPFGRLVVLVLGTFSLTSGLAVFLWGLRHCEVVFRRLASGSGELACGQWASSPWGALLGGLLLVGSAMALASLRMPGGLRRRGLALSGGGALVSTSAGLGLLGYSLGLFTALSGLIFLAMGLRALARLHRGG